MAVPHWSFCESVPWRNAWHLADLEADPSFELQL